MSVETRTADSERSERVKLAVALLLLATGIAAFYFFPGGPLVYRTLGLLAAVAVSAALALQTQKGVEAKDFFVGSRIEVRKVVWPTRQETVQTTLLVIAMVILVALLLWGIDSVLSWLVGGVLGTRG